MLSMRITNCHSPNKDYSKNPANPSGQKSHTCAPFTLLVPVSRIRIRIRIRIHRIHMFLGHLDPDPDPLVKGMDPDPSISNQK
jgi:hypothetical protein